MEIYDVLVNQIKTPLGFQLDEPRITFKVKGANPNLLALKSIKVWTESNKHPIYQINDEKFDNNYFEIKNRLVPRTKYDFEITIKNGDKVAKVTSWFETGKMDEPVIGKWIGNSNKNIANTLFRKSIKAFRKEIKSARLYATGLGVYEAYFDQKKIGDEYLAPGFTNYDQLVQLQTYDVTSFLQKSGSHELLFSVGDGWYKGNIGFNNQPNTYGDQQMILAELHVKYIDGTEETIVSDDSWQTTPGKIVNSGIYYGEDFDDTVDFNSWKSVITLDKSTSIIQDRLSLPLKNKGELEVQKVIKTPKGETVLDFGQNHAGWPTFLNHLPKGKRISLQMGEILQDGNFYNKNLRQARATFTYVSDGKEKWIRPHFTYFGYRYVKVEGVNIVNTDDFKSIVIYSDLSDTGKIETNNKLVNRLFENVIWGEKSNFFDVPTDCPQRDERLGWTGDAEIFAETASFNMNTFAFFKKYARDMLLEQKSHNGMLTAVVPNIKMNDGGMAIWSDAATIIPWLTYQFYGDVGILKQNYSQMKAWVDWIGRHTKQSGLWIGGTQLGDWLALDNSDPHNPQGKTDTDFIASIYYAYSALIVSQSASVLGKEIDAREYLQLSKTVEQNILNEYVTPNGKVAIDTQTAYVLMMYFDLASKKQNNHIITDLIKRIHADNGHLTTGFVGTPYLCPVLSENGQHELATTIFLQKDFPSWLYEVEHGATTIWERWNSVLPDGKMNPEGMNSLNHYSLGAIMAWAYKYVLGINQHSPAFTEILFAPQFDLRLSDVKGFYDTSYGKVEIKYHLLAGKDKPVHIKLKVPFGVKLKAILPHSEGQNINVNNSVVQGEFELQSGDYDISYFPNQDLQSYLDIKISNSDLMRHDIAVDKIDQIDSKILSPLKKKGNRSRMFKKMTLEELLKVEKIDESEQQKVRQALNQIPKY